MHGETVENLLLVMGGFVLIMGVVGLLLMVGQSSIKSLSVEEIDFAALRDGVYAGWFEAVLEQRRGSDGQRRRSSGY